jgi:hypothetical protein
LVERHERTLGRNISTRKDNIKIELSENQSEDVHFTHLGKQREQWRAVVTKVMNIRVRSIREIC